MMAVRRPALVLAASLALVAGLAAQRAPDPVVYHVTIPEPAHHWLQVEATFPDLGDAPLRVRMSRSSPGRYAVHEFARNIFALQAFDGQGRALDVTRPGADEWDVAGHDGAVRIVYRIFGDAADGTHLAVDTTHARINMPATFLWAVGDDRRPIRVTFDPPPNRSWRAATQLFATNDPRTFTAPNLQYFMDSPTELADLRDVRFEVEGPDGVAARFRLAVHASADTTDADVEALGALVARLAREQAAVFGGFPTFEPGAYTFLLDYVPWADGDGMEHRNSTAISDPRISLRTDAGRRAALDSISHELFHIWNVERIRPAGLEPFDFTRENVTCCLWLAEGFTEYYGPLLLVRSGLGATPPVQNVASLLDAPARGLRSAVGMSEQAPFTDAAVADEPTDDARTVVSYYTGGAALALALDFSLRDRSAGAVSLDDYMRRLWQTYGAPAGPRPGMVATPYTLADLRDALAALATPGFADDFFDRYVEGRETPDYARLLRLAGYELRAATPARAWAGDVPILDAGGTLVVGLTADGTRGPVPFDTPLYRAGVDEGDRIVSIDGRPATAAAWTALTTRAPGDTVTLVVARRDGRRDTTRLVLDRDPDVRVVAIDAAGGQLTPAQAQFRAAWLASRQR
jgi:predicted metalloprotease with PDZ domain